MQKNKCEIRELESVRAYPRAVNKEAGKKKDGFKKKSARCPKRGPREGTAGRGKSVGKSRWKRADRSSEGASELHF